MKILITVTQLRDLGGITPSTLNLLNEIKNYHDVTICVLSFKSPNKEIPQEVQVLKGSKWVRDCCAPRTILKEQNIWQKTVRSYRRCIRRLFGLDYILQKAAEEMKKIIMEEYDVAIAYSNDIFANGKHVYGADNFIVDKVVKAKKKVAWVHNDITRAGYTEEICENIYKGFDKIVCVSKDNQRILDSVYRNGRNKSATVYNMFNIDRIRTMADEGINPYKPDVDLHFVTVARIDDQKRIDRIAEVCRRLKSEGVVNFDWTIVGDGSNKIKIEELIRQNSIKNLYLVGIKQNPYIYMKNADASVLSSAYEGYSMTVIESQIVGTPTIVTNYESAYEAVTNGQTGYICDNSTDGLYGIIKQIVLNPLLLKPCKKYLEDNPVDNNIAKKQFEDVIEIL